MTAEETQKIRELVQMQSNLIFKPGTDVGFGIKYTRTLDQVLAICNKADEDRVKASEAARQESAEKAKKAAERKAKRAPKLSSIETAKAE